MKKLLVRVFSACLLGLGLNASAAEVEYSISVDRVVSDLDGVRKTGIGYNGKTPGETLRFKEGDTAVIHVTNNLDEPTSIHWHGLILPFNQDGVPGISFPGIQPGETFTYKFPVVQSGTYWYHSHSGFQEPDGAYGSIVIESAKREPFKYDREYVIQLADPHAHSGDRIMRNLKSSAEYYNRSQRTLGTLLDDVQSVGWKAALEDRFAWGSMKMMPTDIEDVLEVLRLAARELDDPRQPQLGLPSKRNGGLRVAKGLKLPKGLVHEDLAVAEIEGEIARAGPEVLQRSWVARLLPRATELH